jgi:hypothetical protein
LKKGILQVTILFFFSFLFACNKDKEAPELILIGESVLEIPYAKITPDPGALARDKEDGDINNKITSDWGSIVNQNQRGTYEVTYKVKDKSNNESITKRSVIVRFLRDNFLGNYNSNWAITGTSYTGNDSYTITAGGDPNQFVISSYGYNDIDLKVNFSDTYGESLTFYQKDGLNITEGTGTITNNGTTINLNFRIVNNGSNVINGTETLIKI